MAKKSEADRDDDEMLAEDAGGSRVYELGFHIDPELPTEEVKKVYQEMKAAVEGQGALVAEGEPEKVPLAYTISSQETSGRRDFDSAYFAWIAYETSVENHEKVLAVAKEHKNIFRFIDVITTKEAARHAAEVRLMTLKMPEKDTETTSDSELDAVLEGVTVAA